MTLEESATAQARILGTDIAEVFATYNSEEEKYGVTVNFTDDGKDKFTSLTDEAASGSQKIYIYLGEIDDSADLTLTCEEKISGGSTFISGSFETYEDAQNYALQIMSGTFNVSDNFNAISKGATFISRVMMVRTCLSVRPVTLTIPGIFKPLSSVTSMNIL